MVREHDGVVTPVLTLSKPSPCCITIRATLSDLTATSELYPIHTEL